MRLILRRLKPFARPYTGGFLIAAVAALLSSTFQLMGPWVQKQLIDQVLPNRLAGELVKYAILWATAVVLAQCTRICSGYILSRSVQGMTTTIRYRLAEHAARSSYIEFSQRGAPQFISLITDDSSRIAQDSGMAFLSILLGVFSFAGNAALLCIISLPLVIIAVAVIPLVLLLANSIMRPLHGLARHVQDAMGGLASCAKDQLDGARDIRTSGAQGWSAGIVQRASWAYARAFIRRDLFLSYAISAMNLSTLIPTIVVFLVGGYMVLRGRLTIGALVAFSGYLVSILEAPRQLSGAMGSLQPLKASLDRIQEFLDIPEEQSGSRQVPTTVSGLDLRGVSLTYGERTALVGADILVERGRDIAVVGESGSGKSTLAIIMGLLARAQSGSVIVEGEGVGEYQLDSLRRRIQPVFVDGHIFATTLRENIILGREWVSEQHLQRACQIAQLPEVIASLPNGLDEVLQAGGVNLSSGQKQRVALARALVCEPDFLILDEATSSLDAATVQSFWDELVVNANRPTVILISHDLEAASRFECIYVIDRGRVVQTGTHAELSAQDGTYRRLWQARGRAGEHAVSG